MRFISAILLAVIISLMGAPSFFAGDSSHDQVYDVISTGYQTLYFSADGVRVETPHFTLYGVFSTSLVLIDVLSDTLAAVIEISGDTIPALLVSGLIPVLLFSLYIIRRELFSYIQEGIVFFDDSQLLAIILSRQRILL